MRKALIAWAFLLPAVAWGLPDEFTQEGLLVDANGAPLAGAHDLTVRFYAAADGGDPLFEEVHRQVDLFDGYYAISIGSVEALSGDLFTRPSLYLGFSVDGGRELSPRTPFTKVPAAFVADVALNVTGDITPRTVNVGGDVVINENGEWVGSPVGLQGPPGPPGAPGAVDVDEVVNAIINAVAANPGRLPYLSSNTDDTAEGNTITMDGGRLVFRAGAPANSLQLGDNNVIGVNAMRFNDPGFNEGIQWDGTIARIAVSPLNNGDGDGYLRLINDGGISLEDNVRIQGDLSITGVIAAVQSITATVVNATTANITNANITNLNGPGNRVSVQGELNLLGDVRLAAGTDFIGTLRAGGLITGGDIQARNIAASGSIQAGGNIEAGNLLRAGVGGIWVRGVQVFDGNGNLLRRPVYACPAGRVMMGTDGNGLPRCANVTCPVGQYFRGIDANGNATCVADEGIRALPAQNCPAGQAVLQVAANGATTCGSPRAGNQTCPDGQFMTGLTPQGTVICDDPPVGEGPAGGQCRPGDVRPNIYVCTNSGRDVRTFIPAGFNFNVTVGRCDPDANTQAMLVTRSGGGQAAGRAAQWQAYLQAGGNIITEYSISDDVFRAIFGVNVAQGARRGGCHDNAMPPVKINPNDAFWQANPGINVVPAAEAPCGYEVGAFPGITPLGGWAANQVSLAYRDLGEGRLWLVDADWQDNERYWLPQSSALMGAMITWCGAPAEPAANALVFAGVRNNVPEAEVTGWRECHRSFYGQAGISMAQILQSCNAPQIMYGCKANNANAWQVLAQGSRAAVFREIGRVNNPVIDNQVAWYFSVDWSLGFAPAGQAISRNSCDTQNGLGDKRICWHSRGGSMNGGWRCGNNTGLNGNNGYTRVIWTRDPAAGNPPPANVFSFQGVRQNTADAALEGWQECHTSRFGQTTNGLTALLQNNCPGDRLMVGCRPVGSASWTLLAQGARAAVLRDTGRGNVTTRDNGVEWYYNNSWSMGFAPQGNGVSRNSCDTQGGNGQLRMCWHTNGDRITSGYRCGNSFLNGNNNWERRIWRVAAGGGGGGPPANQVFRSCRHARDSGFRVNGVYRLQPPGEAERRVWCDQTTDGGGWTLVASTRDTTLNDERSNYYDDLQRLDPAGGHTGVWWGLRALGGRWDMRFACRDAVRAADAAMTVDLSFYDVPYYTEFTTGTDTQSCFSESNGRGDESPPPMRKNNLNNQVRNRGDQWNAGYLEGEDSCSDTGDFTVDFDDRGMDSNQSDGTDWGEDDGSRKCGRTGLGGGQWFIYTRER
ncbi:MAG: hypothetical protein H6706_18435 [Myxococcales bacterium]|nr:hypothetical protein [Myxococcales bacterium]